jgi:hypothetical protein
MKRLLTLQNLHKNKPGAVLGGGASLPADMDGLPAGCVLFGVNHHALAIGVAPHYVIMRDDPLVETALLKWAQPNQYYLRVHELLDWTDVDLRGVPRPASRAGIFAAWMALYLGCEPVYLCGMDLYQGEKKYCHDGEPDYKPIYDEPLEKLVNDWRELYRWPGVERLRPMAGVLKEVFKAGQYDAAVET